MSLLLLIVAGAVMYYFINVEMKVQDRKEYIKRTGDRMLHNYKDNNKKKRSKKTFEEMGFKERTETIKELEEKWKSITHFILPIALVASIFFPFILITLIGYLPVKFFFIQGRISQLKKEDRRNK